jgi:site-specific DNA-adenine methylase
MKVHPFDIGPSYGFERGEETKFIKWLWNYKQKLKPMVKMVGIIRSENPRMVDFYINLKNERDAINKMFVEKFHGKTWKPYVDHAMLTNAIPDECREYILAKRITFNNRDKY